MVDPHKHHRPAIELAFAALSARVGALLGEVAALGNGWRGSPAREARLADLAAETERFVANAIVRMNGFAAQAGRARAAHVADLRPIHAETRRFVAQAIGRLDELAADLAALQAPAAQRRKVRR